MTVLTTIVCCTLSQRGTSRRGACSQGEVEERRRAVAATGLRPSQRCCRRPPSENSVRLRSLGLGFIKAARQQRTTGAAFTLELTWLGQATRPRVRALGYRRATSYEATMGGTAYGEHRKAAVGWTEGPTSAASGPYNGLYTRPVGVNSISDLPVLLILHMWSTRTPTLQEACKKVP